MVALQPMTSSEFARFKARGIENYAHEKAVSGNWSQEEALGKATEQFNQLLPDDEKTSGHFLFTVFSESEAVGVLWLGKKSNDTGFIYEIEIYPQYQGRGYGKETMKAMEAVAKRLGIKKLELHVIGHNKAARSLYRNLGYEETNVIMAKMI